MLSIQNTKCNCLELESSELFEPSESSESRSNSASTAFSFLSCIYIVLDKLEDSFLFIFMTESIHIAAMHV